MSPLSSPLNLLTAWSFDLSVQLPLLAAAVAFVWAVRRIGRQHPSNPVPTWRVASLLAGLAVIEIALQSAVGEYDDTLFIVHMVQHLLLMLVAAPLIVLGTPITVALRVASADVRRRWLLPILHSRVVTLLSHPLVGLALFTGSLWVTHFSPIYELALENPFVHDLEHVLYLTAALLFWGPIIGADPVRARLPHPVRLVLILFAMVQGSFLGVVIVLAPAPLYAHYQNLHLDYITPLADQQMAGAAMWVVGAILIPLWGGLVFYEWMRAEEAAGIREDARIARAAAAERTRAEAAKRGSEDEARAEVGALRSEEEAKASASQPGRESPPLAPPPLAQGGSDVTAVPSPSASRLQPLASSSADGPASDTLLQA